MPHRQGADLTKDDLLWDQTLWYGQFAIWHNWTPEQVDRLPDGYAERLSEYHKILEEIQGDERDRQDRVRAARQRKGLV